MKNSEYIKGGTEVEGDIFFGRMGNIASQSLKTLSEKPKTLSESLKTLGEKHKALGESFRTLS